MRILSLFAGIGSFEKALKNLGIPCEIVAFSEIDKYAVQSYCAVHNVDSSLNLGDISKIDIKKLPKDIDIVTHRSPCQDFSVAGKNQGGDKGSKTRSSLMWCTVDIVEEVKPKIVLWENVKNVISKKHRHNFDAYVEVMDNLGYNSYYEVLNAKDFGVPQNRERVFTVSIRKDIDNKKFKFPQGFPLTKKLKDVLEKNVDEKYYLSDEYLQRFIVSTGKNKYPFGKASRVLGSTVTETAKGPNTRHFVYDTNHSSPTLDTMQGGWRQPCVITEGNVSLHPTSQAGKVISDEGLAMTICAGTHGYANGYVTEPNMKILECEELPVIVASRGRNPKNPSDRSKGTHLEQTLEVNKQGICNTLTSVQKDNYVIEDSCVLVKEATKKGYKEAYEGDSINITYPSSKTKRGRVGDQIAQTLDTGSGLAVVESIPNFRIRKLTPTECWLLMGFTKDDIEKAINIGISNTQLYKQAGNSIVVDVLEHIFKNIFNENGELSV